MEQTQAVEAESRGGFYSVPAPGSSAMRFRRSRWINRVINLEQREARYDRTLGEINDNVLPLSQTATLRFNALSPADAKFFPELWFGPGFDPKPNHIGCYLSHYALLRDHYANCLVSGHGFDHALAVFEDDVHFCADFTDRLKHLEDNFHEEWDVFMLSAFFHDRPAKWHKKDHEPTSVKHVHRVYGAFTTHAYLVNPRSIPKILNELINLAPTATAIDHAYLLMQPRQKWFAFVPGMATQHDDFSDIGQENTAMTGRFREICGEHVFAEKLEDFKPPAHFTYKTKWHDQDIPAVPSVDGTQLRVAKFSGGVVPHYALYLPRYFFKDYCKIPDGTSAVPMPERKEYAAMLRHVSKLPKGATILDVGANHGLFAVPAAMLGHNVLAFEPVALNIQSLQLAMRANTACGTRLTVLHSALGAADGEATIYVPSNSDNASFSEQAADANLPVKGTRVETVRVLAFDSYMTTAKTRTVDIRFVKIDVQGYELDVIRGMEKFLKRSHNCSLLVEWDEKLAKRAKRPLVEAHAILARCGYRQMHWPDGDRLYVKR